MTRARNLKRPPQAQRLLVCLNILQVLANYTHKVAHELSVLLWNGHRDLAQVIEPSSTRGTLKFFEKIPRRDSERLGQRGQRFQRR